MASDDRQAPRDFEGCGPHPPDAGWPDAAGGAVSFVVNVEEGAEPSIADGDERKRERSGIRSTETEYSRCIPVEKFLLRGLTKAERIDLLERLFVIDQGKVGAPHAFVLAV